MPSAAYDSGKSEPALLQFKSRSGYTLIEIAIVMAVIGMMTLLLLPRLPSSDHENLKISARTLASTIQYMQERAAANRTQLQLIMSPGTESIKIVEPTVTDSEKVPSEALLHKNPVKEGIIIADVHLPRFGVMRDGKVKVDVFASGVKDFTTIHLRSASGNFWTVMAFPAGGKVKAYEGYLEEAPW